MGQRRAGPTQKGAISGGSNRDEETEKEGRGVGVRLGVEWEVLWAGYLCISSGGAYPAKLEREYYEHVVPIGRAGNGVVAESRLVEQDLGRRKTGVCWMQDRQVEQEPGGVHGRSRSRG